MLSLLLGSAWAHIPIIYTATPDDDWCQIIADALGGDYIMLTPGDYVGPCDIEGLVSEPEGEVTIVQSFDAQNLARFVHDGKSDYVLRVSGPGVFNLLQVTFGPMPAGVDAVRVASGNDLMVRFNTFEPSDGRGVVQEGDVNLLRVLDNRFLAPRGDAIVLDCDPCTTGRFEVDGNVVEGGVGAIVVADPGEGQVAENTIADHEGVPLKLTTPSASVERNFVEGGVQIDAARMVNNIVVGDAEVTASFVAHNDLLGDTTVVSGDTVEANATLGVELGGSNVACDASCFADLANRDYFPVSGSPLRSAVPWLSEVGTDFCDNGRTDPTAVGAVEALGAGFGPVEITYRALANCSSSDGILSDTNDTGVAGAGGDTAVANTSTPPPELTVEDGGCGCQAQPMGGAVGAWAILGTWALRRRSTGAGGTTPPLG